MSLMAPISSRFPPPTATCSSASKIKLALNLTLTLSGFKPRTVEMMRQFLMVSLKKPALAALLFVASLAVSLQPAFAEFKVGLVLDRGGKDDKSFNSSAYAGANEAKKKLGIFLKYVEAADDNAYESQLRAFAQRNYDLIIGIGFAQKEAVKKVAAQFPERHFAIV